MEQWRRECTMPRKWSLEICLASRLCDIGGGSPYNTTLELLAEMGCMDRARIVSGMNLPLLLLVLTAADNSPETVKRCVEESQGSLHLFEMGQEDDDGEL